MATLGDWLRRLWGRKASAPAPAPSALRSGFFEALLAETNFLARFPQYAGLLSRIDPVATNTVPVAAVALRRIDVPSARLLLLWNVDFFRAHPECRAGILLHELQHVVCGHLDDPTLHRVAYPRLMEIAMELTANEPIIDPLPEHGFHLRKFSHLGLRAGQSTRERYVLLRDAYERGRLSPTEIWSPRGFDSHRPREAGEAGSGIGDVIDARSDEADERNWANGFGGLSSPSSRATLERMRLRIAEHLRGERGGVDDALHPGARKLAKELERVVLVDGSQSRLDWPRILREAFPRRRRVVADYLRPNRRFPTRVGEIPGRRRRPPRPVLVVAIDTSGSMDASGLHRVTRELARLAPLAKVTVVECDAAVRRVYRLGARPLTVVGGGDTDFGPAFEDAGALREADGLVYFTDGKGTMPDVPPDIPTLWAITHDQPFLADFGSIVRIPE